MVTFISVILVVISLHFQYYLFECIFLRLANKGLLIVSLLKKQKEIKKQKQTKKNTQLFSILYLKKL